MPESLEGYHAILSYFHTVNHVETAPEEPQETTQEVTSNTVETVEAVEIDVFKDKIAPMITPVPSSKEIGAEFDRLKKMFPQYTTEEQYCKAKGITQPHLKRCIRLYQNQ